MATDMWAMVFLPILLVSYLLGCCNGAILISKCLLGEDVRQKGSGNAGLTNFYRNYGAKYAGFVLVVDMLKMAVAVGFSVLWLSRMGVENGYYLGAYPAGLFCMMGHMYPVFFQFRGGKGVLSSGMLLILLDWRIAVIGWGLFLLILLTTRYVSLGSMLSALSFPVTTHLFLRNPLFTLCALLISLLVLYGHRENFNRLLQGNERKFTLHSGKEKHP